MKTLANQMTNNLYKQRSLRLLWMTLITVILNSCGPTAGPSNKGEILAEGVGVTVLRQGVERLLHLKQRARDIKGESPWSEIKRLEQERKFVKLLVERDVVQTRCKEVLGTQKFGEISLGIDQEIEKLIKRRGGDEAYQSWLESKGMDPIENHARLLHRSLKKALLQALMPELPAPNEDRLLAEYRANPDRWDQAAGVKLINVELKTAPKVKDKELSTVKVSATQLLNRFEQGASFAALKRELESLNTEDISLKVRNSKLTTRSRDGALKSAVLSLELGATGELEVKKGTVVMFKVIDRWSYEKRSYDEVRDRLFTTLVNRETKATERAIIQGLIKEAEVSFFGKAASPLKSHEGEGAARP